MGMGQHPTLLLIIDVCRDTIVLSARVRKKHARKTQVSTARGGLAFDSSIKFNK
jgi:hypothetical protein